MKNKKIFEYLINQKQGGVILIDYKGNKYINLADNNECHVDRGDLVDFKTGEIIHISHFNDKLNIFNG